jgi:hypothetical protein
MWSVITADREVDTVTMQSLQVVDLNLALKGAHRRAGRRYIMGINPLIPTAMRLE